MLICLHAHSQSLPLLVDGCVNNVLLQTVRHKSNRRYALRLQKQQMLQRGQGKLVVYNELLQDSHLTGNVSHLSGIITLGNLKLNIDWHSMHTASIKQFHKDRFHLLIA